MTLNMTNIDDTSTELVEKSESQDTPLQNIKLNDPIMSGLARQVLEIIFVVVVNGAVSIAGAAANVINIIIFVKQGFNDSVNISLCGLAISDLGALLPLVWKSICMNPLFRYSDIEFDSSKVHYLTSGWPHRCFLTITCSITAFVTFERCVCIALPIKVKNIITPRRAFISIVVIFTAMFLIVSPVFGTVYIGRYFNIQRNKTVHGFTYTSLALVVQTMSHFIIIAMQLSSFIIVTICTVILIYTLFTKSRWRQKATAASSSRMADSVSSRDKRIMKMVAFISCIFIACFLPNAVNLIVMELFEDYISDVQYMNCFQAIWTVISTLEVVNSSVSIIVYYNMSSKYRTVFNKLFLTKSIYCRGLQSACFVK